MRNPARVVLPSNCGALVSQARAHLVLLPSDRRAYTLCGRFSFEPIAPTLPPGASPDTPAEGEGGPFSLGARARIVSR